MKLTTLLLALFLALVLPARPATDLATLFPEDTTAFFLMPDVHALDKFDEHPVFKAILSPEMKKLFSPFLAEMDRNKEHVEKVWKEELGMSFNEVRALMNGGMAGGFRLRIADLVAGIKSRSGEPNPFDFMDGVIAYQFSGDEATVEKYVNGMLRLAREAFDRQKASGLPSPFPADYAAFPDDYHASADDYHGVKLHLWKAPSGKKALVASPGWALQDKVLIVGFSERALQECVDGTQKGGHTLADSANYRAMLDRTKDREAFGFLNVHAIMDAVMAQLEKSEKEEHTPPQVGKVIRAFGLDKFDTAYFAFGSKGSGVDADFGLTFHDQPALMDFIAIDGPGVRPTWIPKDVDTVAWGTIDLGKMLDVAQRVIAGVDEDMAAYFNTQLDTLRKKMGVDVKKDLLQYLGTDFWSASKVLHEESAPARNSNPEIPDLPVQSQVVGLKLKDRKAFELSFNTLINTLAPGDALFETRKIQGFTVRNLKAAPQPMGLVFTDDWLIFSVGPQELLEKVLARIEKGEASDSILTKPAIASALDALPSDDDGTSVMDFGAFVRTMVPLGRQMARLGAFGPDVKSSDIPENLEIPLVIASREYREAGALRFRVHIEPAAK